jgi:hypothetical protein
MKTLHTKGNWKTILDPTMCTVHSDVFGGICQIPHMGKHKEEHEANARLIAAAPELLEMVKELCRSGEEALDHKDGSGKPILQESIWKAKELITNIVA